jgi:uncharacterized protein
MNKRFLLLGCLLFSALSLLAQKDYKVVFDFTSKDSLDQKTLIRWLNEVSKSPEARMEVVMYGQGTALVVKGRSLVADEITRLAAGKQVSFKVCSAALKNQGLDNSQLLPGVEIVPDGIYEIITKQREGWGYIKVKN